MDQSPVTLLITRPEAASRRFAAQMQSQLGNAVRIVVSPLLGISYRSDPPDFPGARGLIFTSANGVQAVHERLPDIPVFVVGAATGSAAKACGANVSAVFSDANELVEKLPEMNPVGPLLHIRGQYAQGNIALRLSDAGIAVKEHVAYNQPPIALTQEARAALSNPTPVVAPLFSARTARQLVNNAPFAAPLYVAAISPVVAEAFDHLAPMQLAVAKTPDGREMADLTARLVAAAAQLEDPQPPK